MNPLDWDSSDAINIIRVDAQRRSSSLGEMPARTGTRSDKYDPELSDAFEDIKTEGVGEEWWEILFEDIGILPTVQQPLDEEHTYAMEDLQGETPCSH